MSNSFISSLLHSLIFLTDTIFVGSKFIVPVVVLIKLLKVKITKPDILILIRAVNSLILISGVLFLIVISANFILTLRSGNDDEFNFMMSQVSGAHWYQFVLPVIGYGVLTQFLWIKKFRNSYWASLIIILSWITISVLVDLLTESEKLSGSPGSHRYFPWMDYLGKSAVYIIILALNYFRVGKQRN